MATIVAYIDDVLYIHSDKRTSNWYFISSIWPTLIIILIYLSLVYGILPAYMKHRKPYSITTTLRIYNLFQIATCMWLIYWILTSGWIQGDYELSCQPIDYSDRPRALDMLRAFYWGYFLKMSEMIETVFFILRKKTNQITKLHVYHHASTFLIAWIGCKYVGGGMSSFPYMLNCFIHILMYSYYYLSSLGPAWQKTLSPWKPRLTMAQMVQFTILLLHAMMIMRPGCVAPRKLAFIYLPNVVLIFKMFYDFYKTSYTEKETTKTQ